MKRRFGILNSMLAVAAAIILIAALACGDDEVAEEPEAAQVVAPAATVETAVKVADPKATAVPAKAASQIAIVQPTTAAVAAAGDAPLKAAEAAYKYVAPVQVPGVYWDYIYTGPTPSKFNENPRFAEMVKQGKLPPVEERLPEEFKVNQPPHGIGTYGGTWRITSTGGDLWGPNRMYWHKKNADAVLKGAHVGFDEISDDGRVYTFRLRKGLKFSDGEPLDMEDIRFAWEDANFNKTLIESPPNDFIDAVTGNTVSFAVIDDMHWTLTYDTPNFILMEGEVRPGMRCTAWTFCFYAPSHYLKKWHEDYADPADIKKMIEENEVGDWKQLWGLINNLQTQVGMPMPAPFVLSSKSETLSIWESNPYFFVVDPEGNQLPYVDGIKKVKVESREVGVFRAMAGETDLSARGTVHAEIPLYRSNMGKGDFNIKIWPETGPGDYTAAIGQTYNTDPEIGKWIRTTEFRQALSLAMDREAILDTILLGIGTPKNWVAHPSTPYYPGDKWAFHNTEYDPDKANEILDSLGLTERDSEGFRLRSDGSGERLSFTHVSQMGAAADIMELETDYFADVGIYMKNKPMNSPWSLSSPGIEYMDMWIGHFGFYGANPWFAGWSRCCSNGAGDNWTPDINQLPTSMKRGPDGAKITEGGYTPKCECPVSDIWLPKAPDNTYPADPTGTIAWMQDNWVDGWGLAQYSPERIAIGKEIHRIHGEQKFMLSVAAHTGAMIGLVLNKNNFMNAPETHMGSQEGFYGELYYFVDGKDNIGD